MGDVMMRLMTGRLRCAIAYISHI